MSYKLLSAILKAPWYIDEGFVDAHGPIIANLLSKEIVITPNSKEEESRLPYAFNHGPSAISGSLKRGYDYDSVSKGAVAVIPVHGVLMKEDFDDGCGYFAAGTATVVRRIQEADAHKNISGIIVHFDTPGGTVDGTQALADAIKDTSKPIISFIDGMCASAGIYAACAADYIIAENKSALVGSIGTMISIVDKKPYFEKLGVKFHNINSDLSPDKNKDFYSALEGDYKGIKDSMLNPFAKLFQEFVKSNRPTVKEDSMTGKIYLAEEALSRNLIDEIGKIDAAVLKLNELANAKATASDTKPKSKIEMKQFALLNALLGIEMLESTEEGAYLNEEQLQAIEDRLAATAKAEQDLATAQESLSAANKNLETANASIEDLNGRITEMAKGPAEKPASVKTDTNAVEAGEEDLNAFCEKNDTAAAVAKLLEKGIK